MLVRLAGRRSVLPVSWRAAHRAQDLEVRSFVVLKVVVHKARVRAGRKGFDPRRAERTIAHDPKHAPRVSQNVVNPKVEDLSVVVRKVVVRKDVDPKVVDQKDVVQKVVVQKVVVQKVVDPKDVDPKDVNPKVEDLSVVVRKDAVPKAVDQAVLVLAAGLVDLVLADLAPVEDLVLDEVRCLPATMRTT